MMRSTADWLVPKSAASARGGQVGAQMDQHEQHPALQRQSPGPAGRRLAVAGQGADGVDLAGGEPGERQQVSVSVWQRVVVGG